MTLIEKIAAELGIDCPLAGAGFNYTVFSQSAYFQGVKGIESFSPAEISLYLKKGRVLIEGEQMQIKKWYMGDVAIIGSICAVRRLP